MFAMVDQPHPPLPIGANESMKDFLMSCFIRDYNKRASASTLLNHPWIKASLKAVSFVLLAIYIKKPQLPSVTDVSSTIKEYQKTKRATALQAMVQVRKDSLSLTM